MQNSAKKILKPKFVFKTSKNLYPQINARQGWHKQSKVNNYNVASNNRTTCTNNKSDETPKLCNTFHKSVINNVIQAYPKHPCAPHTHIKKK